MWSGDGFITLRLVRWQELSPKDQITIKHLALGKSAQGMEASVNPSRNQHSLAVSCEIRGQAIGQESTCSIHPAPVNTGIRFIRIDMSEPNECQASVDFREEASLRTNLVDVEVRLQMFEHLILLFRPWKSTTAS